MITKSVQTKLHKLATDICNKYKSFVQDIEFEYVSENLVNFKVIFKSAAYRYDLDEILYMIHNCTESIRIEDKLESFEIEWVD